MENKIGFKIAGLDNWLWFEKKKVMKENGRLIASEGWVVS